MRSCRSVLVDAMQTETDVPLGAAAVTKTSGGSPPIAATIGAENRERLLLFAGARYSGLNRRMTNRDVAVAMSYSYTSTDWIHSEGMRREMCCPRVAWNVRKRCAVDSWRNPSPYCAEFSSM